jgi:hypothetical protein
MEDPAPRANENNNVEATLESSPPPADADGGKDDEALKSPESREEIKPTDIRQLTIKNLDTGEEFIIGENDPDFEFDTFEIGGRKEDATANATNPNAIDAEQQGQSVQERISWWRALFHYLYGSKQSKDKIEEKIATAAEDHADANAKPKTPFTKLSSFKIRRELGRGAFGRVLLAEAKTDVKLYALKIISKKNMRSSDKRQAKAERDILFAMTLKAPHPFTSGLKFAFQSENNLYLGMDYIPGGHLRELIKKFKYLPEVMFIYLFIYLNLFLFDFLYSNYYLYPFLSVYLSIQYVGLGQVLCSRINFSNFTFTFFKCIIS